MYGKIKEELQQELQSIKESGLYKEERIITTPQGVEIKVEGKAGTYLNFCANNYLGLSSHPRVIKAAHDALDKHGYGMSSVRFICGTEDLHKNLEKEISKFLQTDDTILYVACFDANGGVFEPFFQENDAIISDELNHASIIDGVRLSKAQRFRYKNSNMEELEGILKNLVKDEGGRMKDEKNAGMGSSFILQPSALEPRSPRKIIVTDGVFSMDGSIAKLGAICDLADKYQA